MQEEIKSAIQSLKSALAKAKRNPKDARLSINDAIQTLTPLLRTRRSEGPDDEGGTPLPGGGSSGANR